MSNFETVPARWWRKLNNAFHKYLPHIKVLLYHRVTRLASDPLRLSVTPELFYQQLAWLKKNYRIISPGDLAESLLHQKRIKEPAILVSFDDGYADNLYEALPILESLEIPAIFFITTSQLNTNQLLWWDELERMILSNETLAPELFFPENTLGENALTLPTGNRQRVFSCIHDKLQYSTLPRRTNILNSLRHQITLTPANDDSHRLLNYEELKQLADSRYAGIGGHTQNHISLGVQENTVQKAEMTENRNLLETLLNKQIDYLSYPYGSNKDFSNNTLLLAREAGFSLAFANYYGYTTVKTDPYKIPRILVRNWEVPELNREINRWY